MSASRWISKVASTVLGCSAGDVDGALNRSELATAFFAGGEGSPNKLLVYSQNGSVFATSGDLEALTGKCAYFVRLCEGALTPQNVETEVNFGTLEGSTLTMLSRLITQVRAPAHEHGCPSSEGRGLGVTAFPRRHLCAAPLSLRCWLSALSEVP